MADGALAPVVQGPGATVAGARLIAIVQRAPRKPALRPASRTPVQGLKADPFIVKEMMECRNLIRTALGLPSRRLPSPVHRRQVLVAAAHL